MSNLPVDKDKDYMYQMWGTTSLTSDYNSLDQKSKVIQEIMHDDVPKNQHHLKEQSKLHQKIRNSNIWYRIAYNPTIGPHDKFD